MPAYVSGISKVTLRSLMIIAAGMVVLILPLSPFWRPITRRPSAGTRPKARSRYLSIPSAISLIPITLWKAASSAGLPLFSSGSSITSFWPRRDAVWLRSERHQQRQYRLPGYIGARYHLILDSTALSMMLWEVGIIGVILFIAMIAAILIGMRPKETFSATISNGKIYSCSAPRLRFTSLPLAVCSAFPTARS